MKLSNITWKEPEADDLELLSKLPSDLKNFLEMCNGCIIHNGALHIRGLSQKPSWHSLREAWLGKNSFTSLYEKIRPEDIPFAQDQMGDQYLLRDGRILLLSAETGDTEEFASSLTEFFENVEEDIEEYLNVGLDYPLEPGKLIHAYPPFCTQESGDGSSLKPVSAEELILFHADFAKQISKLDDGEQIKITFTD